MRKVLLAAILLSAAGAAGAVTPLSLPNPQVWSPIGGMEPEASPAAAVVPEPTTWAMLVVGFGLAGLGLRRRTPQGRRAA